MKKLIYHSTFCDGKELGVAAVRYRKRFLHPEDVQRYLERMKKRLEKKK